MARLKDMLEPEETVLHRGNSLTRVLRVTVGTAGFIVLMLTAAFIDPEKHGVSDMFRILGLIGLVAVPLMAIVAIPLTLMFSPHDACILTDRRILFRRGLRQPEITEIVLSEIEDVAVRGGELRIAGPGRVIELHPSRVGIGADLLAQIMPRRFPDSGRRVARPGLLLQPGERIVFHFPPRYLGWAGKISAICFAGGFLFFGYDDFVERDWPGILNTLLLAAMVLWFFYPSRDDRHGWYCLVTDRRLLQHFDWDHTRYEEIPLAEIEADWRSQFADKLAATHNGRDFDIPAKGKDAERVLAAIQAARGEA